MKRSSSDKKPMTLSAAWHLLAAIYRGRWLTAQDERDYWRKKYRECATEKNTREGDNELSSAG